MPRVAAKSNLKKAKAEMYRSLILEAAEEAFAEHGYDDAKIQDIAAAAGIALGTMYTVFPGKAEIYDAVNRLRGEEVLNQIAQRIQGAGGLVDTCLKGIEGYVRCLANRPNYLRMHLREGLSWTESAVLRSGEQVIAYDRGMELAHGLLRQGMENGELVGNDPPELLIKMMIAAHQVQLGDWVARGADEATIDDLIWRMQDYFLRAHVTPSHIEAARQGMVRRTAS